MCSFSSCLPAHGSCLPLPSSYPPISGKDGLGQTPLMLQAPCACHVEAASFFPNALAFPLPSRSPTFFLFPHPHHFLHAATTLPHSLALLREAVEEGRKRKGLERAGFGRKKKAEEGGRKEEGEGTKKQGLGGREEEGGHGDRLCWPFSMPSSLPFCHSHYYAMPAMTSTNLIPLLTLSHGETTLNIPHHAFLTIPTYSNYKHYSLLI